MKTMSTLTKLAAAAAITTATAVALGGPAHAVTGAYNQQATTSGTYSDGTSAPAAPTQNLANLSRNMRAVSKGVSAAVYFDRGLVTAGSSVAIPVRGGNVAQTSGYYNNTSGSRLPSTSRPTTGASAG